VRPSWEMAFLILFSSGILQIELCSALEIKGKKRESSSSSKEGLGDVNSFWKYSKKYKPISFLLVKNDPFSILIELIELYLRRIAVEA
jgi:hypothetical protein